MADQAPPEDVQNSNTGSSAGGADASAVATPSFPDRLRVHALAKIIGVTSKQVLAKLGDLGIEARSAQSSLGRDVAETVHAAFTTPEDTAAAPVAVDAPAVEEKAGEEKAGEEPAAQEPAVDKPAESKPAEPTQAVAEPTGLFSTEDVAVATERAPGDRPAFTGPLFLQPEAVAEAPRARRRSKKAAGPAVDANATDGMSESTGSVTSESAGATADAAVTATPETVGSDAKKSSDENSKTGSGNELVDTDDARAESDSSGQGDEGDDGDDQSQPRRRRRGRRGRGRGRGDQSSDGTSEDGDSDDESQASSDGQESSVENADSESDEESSADGDSSTDSESGSEDKPSGERRSRRRSRSRGGSRAADSSSEDESTPPAETDAEDSAADASADDTDDDQDESDGSSRRRRRRRRRRSSGEASSDAASSEDDPPNTVVHEREPRNKPRTKDEVQGISGSTRLEAKRQRRRDGRDAGRRRPPILTESEFLARRESVDRVMVVREKSFPDHGDTTQVAVLEDGVLVEHFVTSSASASMVGNVYLGRVQNVLPSMEAAFIDIGRGRNGVLYAGEVNWDAAGLGGNSRKIEQALKPGDQVLVQVSKDPVGHKGARLTTQLSLAGRYLVYVPGGSSTGISRKLPDTERKRLKEILREIVPAEAGVIIRTAAEGVSEEELARDVTRLQAQWATIEEASAKAESSKGSQPQTLYEEPDLLVKVIRDLFNEDFVKLVIEGEKAWTTTSNYIETVAADMLPKLQRHVVEPGQPDVFEAHRIDEQLAKALDRKVWLPSGGTLVIDRTEAMTVVDVNTGKFTGAGGNLEETVTRNNLEAAEEVVRQMRLRDIGGMIVVDFIDMVLEQNRDLVLRRLTEALGRDRTRHQVSEVTSLGLVQMTRKKLGTGLVEAFSTNCEHCQGRGIIVHPFPVESKPDDGSRSNSSRGDSSTPRKRRGRDKSDNAGSGGSAGSSEHSETTADPSIKRAHPVALAMAAHHDDVVADVTPADVIDNGTIDNGADSASESTPQIIGASEVAAAQGNSSPDTPEENATDSSSAPAGTASAPEPSEVPARRGGRSGRRKASRPAAAAPAGAPLEPAVEVPSDVAVEVPSDVAGEVSSEVAGEVPSDVAQDSTTPEPTVSDAVAGSAEPDSAASESSAGDPSGSPAAEPVVKARRGRRVARKAAAPAAEAPDAGTVFVIPATSDAGTDADEPAPAPVTAPAFTQVDSVETVQEVPVTKPRRRRAAARPAGPPVDA
ncbi:translation initiation factor IF-2 N-terminal domain-containing protein [Rhodococcus sovatensis]|uniref:Translation initiation factor IF-2 N-terminal domain-containing protein n=1 Tax=Rhodococcus sovatensis TaxID=1805840 RepID=A0ABZ2PLI7_9NOCA